MKSFQNVVWTRRWIILAVIVLAACCIKPILSLTVPSYSATAEITYVGHAADAVVLPADLPDFALSTNVLERAVKLGHLPITADQLGVKASVRVSPHSDIVPITFKSRSPQLAADGANAIADATILEYKRLATRQYDEVIAALRTQLAHLGAEERNADSEVRSSVDSDPLAAVNTGLDSLTARLDLIDQARAAARAKLAQDIAAASATAGGSSMGEVSQVIKQEAIAHDPAVMALSAQHAKDFADLQAMRAGYSDSYPAIAGAADKVKGEDAATQVEADRAARSLQGSSTTYTTLLTNKVAAEATVAGDRAQVDALEAQFDAARDRLHALSKITLPADNARIARDSAVSSATQIASRLQSTLADKEQAASLNSIVVLDHATDVVPSISRVVALITIAIAVLGLAVGAAYLAEFINPRIRNRQDVEKLYEAPLLGSM